MPGLLAALIGYLRNRDPLLVPAQMIVLRALEAHVEQQHSSSSTSSSSQLLQFIQEDLQLPRRLEERMLYDAACIQQRIANMKPYERTPHICRCTSSNNSSTNNSSSSTSSSGAELLVDGEHQPPGSSSSSSSSGCCSNCCPCVAGVDSTERWIYPADVRP